MKKLLIAAALFGSITTGTAQAAAPIMFSSLNDFNAPSANEVKGARLAVLHGDVDKVTGLDVALIGMSETSQTIGVNLGFFGANKVKTSMTGASFGIFNWHEGNDVGANLGLVNLTQDVKGANVSAVNYSKGDTMVDVGLASISEKSTVQVGFFNMTKEIKGVQVGLINCAENGFLPCFPIVNFSTK